MVRALLADRFKLTMHQETREQSIYALVLAPDVSFLGYLAGPRVGAFAYNAAHSTVGPIALALVGQLAPSPGCIAVALIWFTHIGADRLLGYGLKYDNGFGSTHLGRIGRGA